MDVAKSDRRRPLLGAGLAMLCVGACGAAAADDEAVQAVWTAKPLRFTYMGFTSKYSCDGLRDKLRGVLQDLGARDDLKLNATGCSGGFGRPTPFPGVSATINVLEPLDDKSPAPNTPLISAHWKTVVVAPRGEPLAAAGECELIEQVKTRILPLFSIRNEEYSSTCIPNQLQPGGTRLKVDVLIADPKPAKAP
jgi:hypothetical protein